MESAVSRIRALLEKSRDPAASEAEAAAAVAMAERLLARHALSLADVTRLEIVSVKTGIRYLEPWVRNMAVHAARLYGCEPLVVTEIARSTRGGATEYKSLTLFGRQVSTDVAVSMINYLIATVVRLSRDYSSVRRDQLGFQRGAGERVATRLWELRKEQTARAETQEGTSDGTSLVVVEQSEASRFMHETVKTHKVRQRGSDTSSRASHDGLAAGAGISLGGQVGGAPGSRMLN